MDFNDKLCDEFGKFSFLNPDNEFMITKPESPVSFLSRCDMKIHNMEQEVKEICERENPLEFNEDDDIGDNIFDSQLPNLSGFTSQSNLDELYIPDNDFNQPKDKNVRCVERKQIGDTTSRRPSYNLEACNTSNFSSDYSKIDIKTPPSRKSSDISNFKSTVADSFNNGTSNSENADQNRNDQKWKQTKNSTNKQSNTKKGLSLRTDVMNKNIFRALRRE